MVSLACNREGCGYICHIFLLFLHCGGGEFPCGVAPPLPIQGVACRGSAVKEWNHGVSGGVGVALVIGQYFELGCFGIATLLLSKELWVPVFPFTILFAVFTTSSARPLDWGYMTEDSLCLTHHILRNFWNMLEVKGRLLLVLSSSGAPYVRNSC